MALLLIDSFDAYGSSYATVLAPMKWNLLAGTVLTGRRADGKGLFGLAYGTKYLEPAVSDWAFGFALYWDGRAVTTPFAFGYIDGYAYPHRDWGLCVDALGRIYAVEYTLQNPGPTWEIATTLFTCSAGMVANAWNYIECKQTGSPGTATVRVNGNTVGSGSLVEEDQTGIGFRLETNSGLGIDDFYLISLDAETADFLGDTAIEAYFMASTDTAEWTPNVGGADNHEMVDENPSDEETTHNATDAVNKTDLFQLDPAGISDLTLEVFGVQLTVRAEKVNTASLDLRPLIKSGTTESLGTQWGLPTGYGNFPHPLATNPDTSAAWTVAEILAAKYGYRSVAAAG